jgi:hypothetical protein
MQQSLDIVELIENNPIKNFNKEYHNKFIEKIKKNFNENQINLFVASFYSYLNYDQEKDYVIDLNNIWKWLGFARKEFCKVVLEKHFEKETHYKILLLQPKEKSKGRPKESILMNIKTFKKLCMKACTKTADDIHDYFIKLEKIFHEIINEGSNELREQLKLKDKELDEKNIELLKANEKYLLKEFHDKDVVYIIKVDKELYKYGYTNNIKRRLKEHKTTYDKNSYLIYCIEDTNNKVLESSIKEYISTSKLYEYHLEYNNAYHYELIKLKNNELNDFIEKIIELRNINIDTNNNIIIFNLKQKNAKLEIELNKCKQILEHREDLEQKLNYYKNNYVINLEEKISKLEEELEKYRIVSTKILEQKEYINFIDNYLQYNPNNKILLKDILQKFNDEYYNTNLTKLNFKELLKIESELIKCIEDKFEGNVIYKNSENKKYDRTRKIFLNLSFKNSSTFYNDEIYIDFIKKYISIKDKTLKTKDGFVYKVKVSEILSLFYKYIEDNSVKSIYTLDKITKNEILLKREIKSNIIKYTNSKIIRTTFNDNNTIAFVGILLK